MKLVSLLKRTVPVLIFFMLAHQLFPQHQEIVSPQKAATETIPDSIVKYFGQDTVLMFQYLNYYLALPETEVSVTKKTELLKNLSADFAAKNDYKTSYILLKKIEELNTQQQNKEKASQELSAKSTNTFPLYFTVFSFLTLTLSVLYLLWYFKYEKRQLNELRTTYESQKLKLENQRKNLEDKINRKTKNLQEKIDELTTKEAHLKAELKKAEEANYFKNAFLANMGFDIRTPLNSIIGFANLLETELAVRKNKELYNYAAGIEQSGYYLLRMLNNIIDLSGLEANTIQLEIKPVLFEHVLDKIAHTYEVRAREKGLVFKTKTDEDLPPILADEKGLEKVLNQILENAIAYTQDGFVTVNSIYDDTHDLAVIEVIDTGVGMDKKFLDNIFLSKTPEIKKEDPSTINVGLGLRLAKKYVEMMNGRLMIQSVLEEGTTVTVQLPCSESAELIVEREETKPEKAGRKVTAKMHELGKLDIFVVEDDRMNRMIIEKILSDEGKVTLAVDGDNCMEIIDNEAQKGHYFQVMLFDINLPEPWDGIKLMKEIRKKYPEYRKIPFIAQTAYAMAGDKERFLKEGFDSYIAKPIDKNELINLVYRQLELFKGLEKTQ